MADPYSNQILNATEEEKKRRLQDAEARAAATEQANQAYIGNLETAQAANQAALDQSQQNYNNLMAKYNNDFAAMVQGESDRIRKEQEEARTMIQADQKAAQWSGLTELASSVANMIGVGSFNAANQQYRSYSQDWMKKADQDLREHRYRMDNVRARQNALKQQQLNLQMGQAGQALARENERIKQQYNDRMALAEAQRNAALQPMDIRSKAADEAGELGLRGVRDAAGQYNTEAALRQRAFEHTAAMQAKGLNADGTPNEKLMADHAAAASRVSSAGKGGIPIKITVNGQDKTLYIEKEAYQNALKRSIPDLKKDVLAMAKKQDSDIKELKDLVSAAANKKTGKWPRRQDNPLYGNDLAGIAVILEKPTDQYTEDDWDAISSWAQSHYDETENLNRHLVDVGNGTRDSFWQGEIPPTGGENPPTGGENPPAGGESTPRFLRLQSGNYDRNNPWNNQ